METEKNKLDELNNEKGIVIISKEKYLNDRFELLKMSRKKILFARKIKLCLLVVVMAVEIIIFLPQFDKLKSDLALSYINVFISLFLGILSLNIGGSLEETEKQIFDLASSYENIKDEKLRKELKKEYDSIVSDVNKHKNKRNTILFVEKILPFIAILFVIFMAMKFYPSIYDYLKYNFILIVLFLMVIIIIMISIVIYLILKKD